jgi:hypothetical protein
VPAARRALSGYDRLLMKNHQELLVEALIRTLTPKYPELVAHPELREDVACIALNHLKPRYFRKAAQLQRHMTQQERDENDAAVRSAVLSAIEFVILNGDELLSGQEDSGALEL